MATQRFISKLSLSQFRNYHAASLDLDARPIVLTGRNGSGKTNLLEAVSFLSPGRGLRRARLEDVARKGDGRASPPQADGGWAVSAILTDADGETRIGTGLDPQNAGEAPQKGRRVRINQAPASTEKLLEYVRIVWLTPAMDGLFTGPAGDRRRFLDRLVLARDPAHARRVSAFEKALTGRNKMLENPSPDAAWLTALEAQIAELGTAIAFARRDLVAALGARIETLADPSFPKAQLSLEGAFEDMLSAHDHALDVETAYATLLDDTRRRDAAAGRTLDGPHRSDLVVLHREKSMPAALASTGEQKALLIGLVLAHARLMAERNSTPPFLLLDEIAAHLDAGRRAALFDTLLSLGGQAFMTGTDPLLFEALGDRAQHFTVENGAIMPGSSA